MLKPVNEIVSRVMMLLDESEPELEKAVVFGDMGMELRRLARELVCEGARTVFLRAEADIIDEVLLIPGECTFGAGDIGEIPLPADFLRLVGFRMSDWPESLAGFHEPERILSAPEKSGDTTEYAGEVLRHHPRDPAQIRIRRPEETVRYGPGVTLGYSRTGRVLRVFGSAPGATPVTAVYLPRPQITSDRIWLPSGLEEDVARAVAGMVRDIIEIE